MPPILRIFVPLKLKLRMLYFRVRELRGLNRFRYALLIILVKGNVVRITSLHVPLNTSLVMSNRSNNKAHTFDIIKT